MKTKLIRWAGVMALMAGVSGGNLGAGVANNPLILFNGGAGLKQELVVTSEAQTTRTPEGALRVQTGHRTAWPGITLKADGGPWDLSIFRNVVLEVKNPGTEQMTLSCRVDNAGADGVKNCVTSSLRLEPGAAGTLTVPLSSTPWRLSAPVKLVGMRGNPEFNEKLDPSRVTQLVVFLTKPARDHTFEVRQIRAEGTLTTMDAAKVFPLIDEFGQFAHADWPGKVHSVSELQGRIQAEAKDLAAKPGPTERDQYGGWKGGPQLPATGFFRVEKYQGKWWLVDPDGRLFWSHGIDCVHKEAATPITDREHYFRSLPEAGAPFARFYGSGSWAPHGYYQTRTPYKTYDFAVANLWQKYGDGYDQIHADVTHRRLKSWGLNTVANWSDRRIYGLRKTPYTATLSPSSKSLEGSEGYWGKFDDVFDPGFRESIRRGIEREKGAAVDDPWCLGFFVHNEIAWGDDTSLAVATLRSPAQQAAKKVFVDELKSRYEEVAKLNATWGTTHPSWEGLLLSTNAPDLKKAGEDLRAFYTRFAETYFEVIRDELRKVAPKQLYLGCRFAWVNDRAARAGAKFCDVVSYNRYEYSVADLKLPDNLDKPLIIGEFHFGALDRGMFHTGLRVTASQQDRAAKYKAYVQGALRNPALVGTHWFQFKDQATTGRPDGENYQIGFLDICDTPYTETVEAAREVGYGMYEYRMK